MQTISQLLRRIARALKKKFQEHLGRGYIRSALRSTGGLGLTPEAFVLAYLQGLFPLGRPSGRVDWQTLTSRAVIDIDEVHVSKRLKTYLRKEAFEIRFDEQFPAVLAGCADREETWINNPLLKVYSSLHARGIAHSVEAYQDDQLVGGGFGLAIGNVFFLESMYCTVDHASKVAFVKLAEQLKQDGFKWIDCQYLSEHWRRFGAKPMPRAELVKLTAHGLNCGQLFLQSQDLVSETLVDEVLAPLS